MVRGQWYLSATPDDEQLPDLVDSWGQPILYVRRLRSIGPLVGDPSTTSPQFTMAGLYGYLASDELGELGADQVYTAGSNPSGSILSQSAVPLNEGNFARIIEHPALAGQPRGAFALFSAGPDGVYFSATDGPGTPTSPETDLANFPATVIEEFDDVRVFGGG